MTITFSKGKKLCVLFQQLLYVVYLAVAFSLVCVVMLLCLALALPVVVLQMGLWSKNCKELEVEKEKLKEEVTEDAAPKPQSLASKQVQREIDYYCTMTHEVSC
jgi:hypothetical protein